MIDYTGLDCPVCGKPFTEKDEDIVVCPECGAPHHRECYAAHGRCGCAEQHGTDQSWDKQSHTAETAKKPCPHCQGLNEENAVFCVHCGKSMEQTPPPPYGAAGQRPPYGAPFNTPFGARPGQPFDPLCGISPNEDFDGVPASELVKTVRVNTRYYMTIFSRIKNQNRSRFNFIAFLLGGIWMLYRKQYKTGILYTAINVALYAASSVVSLLFTAPTLQNIYNDLGITSSTVVTNSLMERVAAAVQTLSPGMLCLFFLPLLFSALRLAMNIFLGIKANRWYMKHCVRTAKEIQEKHSSVPEREAAYQRWGGVNTMTALAVISVYMIANYIIPALL